MKKLILLLVLPFFVSCGPSQEEIEAYEKAKGESAMRHVKVTTDNCGCSDYTATFYDINGHEYVGKLSNTYEDILAHIGECKLCEKTKIHLMDSIVKANLKEFFTTSK